MLVISTYVEKSDIQGLGLFTGQKINKGDIIWFYDPIYDQVFFEDEFKKMLSVLEMDNQEKFKKWIYKRRDTYVLCSDNAKFFNHSDTPNCDDSSDLFTFADRDIEIGEELTCNYKVFDESESMKGPLYEEKSEKVECKVGEAQS